VHVISLVVAGLLLIGLGAGVWHSSRPTDEALPARGEAAGAGHESATPTVGLGAGPNETGGRATSGPGETDYRLVRFPSTRCRFEVPAGFRTVVADRQRGEAFYSEARGEVDGVAIAISCHVDPGPLPARTAAREALGSPGVTQAQVRRFEGGAVGGASGWIAEYTGVVNASPVRVSRAFRDDGTQLSVVVPAGDAERAASVVTAVVAAFRGRADRGAGGEYR
jgi:hypothetical protein